MISRRSFLTQAGVLAASGAGFWWLRNNVLWPEPDLVFHGEARGTGWMPFSSIQPRVVILRASVNGAPVRALLDSGAESSVIDRQLSERLALPATLMAPVMAVGVSGAPQVGRSAMMDVRLGDLTFKGLRAAVLDLAGISSASGRGFEMILGQDLLRQVIADLDFPRDRVSLHEPAAYVLPEGARPATARTDGREMLVPVTVEGDTVEVALDTGASGALALSGETAQTLGLLDGRRVRTARSITFGGVSEDRVVRAERLTFADTHFDDVFIAIYSPARGAPVPPGLLGVGVLERFRVILDQAGGRLHLLPAPPRPRPRRRRS